MGTSSKLNIFAVHLALKLVYENRLKYLNESSYTYGVGNELSVLYIFHLIMETNFVFGVSGLVHKNSLGYLNVA